jgi:aldo/keto reductase
MYDFSKEHILSSVDGILKRLRTDYLDVLVLHRPDALMEPEEVAEAFNQLQQSGKVRNFGVSNHKSSQIRLLQKYISQPLVTDQLQFSLPNSSMIQSGMEVNMTTAGAIDRDDSILDFCRLNDITIQTWSPFQYGFFEGVFIGSDKYPELNHCLEEIADKYHTTPTTIAAAWILRHPAHMQLIAGTTKPSRFREICAACDITLTREEWYRLYLAAGHILP